MTPSVHTMRDCMIARICERMKDDPAIFFVSADLGAPNLDMLRKEFPDRFINVGIAEQNLINISTGLALEGYAVYAYAIAPFLSMRCLEQIRNNLSLMSQTRELNVNLISVGAGLSYEVSGPSHHSPEDISVIRSLPNITFISPSDTELATSAVDYTLKHKQPKYIRLDGKPVPKIYDESRPAKIAHGFYELMQGDNVCLATTGIMTHKALRIAQRFLSDGVRIGVIDMYLLNPIQDEKLSEALTKYETVLTLEEAFVGKGGLDSIIRLVAAKASLSCKVQGLGLKDEYLFEMGGREHLHHLCGIGEDDIADIIRSCM